MKTNSCVSTELHQVHGARRRSLPGLRFVSRANRWHHHGAKCLAAVMLAIGLVFSATAQVAVTGPSDPHLNFTGVFPGAEYYGGWNAGTLQIGNASLVQNESRVPNNDNAVVNPPNFGPSAQDIVFNYISDRDRYESGGAAQTFTFTVVPNRPYLVQFLYHDGQSSAVGQRIFNVVFNGVILATNLDLVAWGAYQTNAVDVLLTNVFTTASGSVTYSAAGSSVAGGVGNAILNAATLQDIGPSPYIYTQPVSKAINDGNSVQFSVLSAGTNVVYQWQACASGTGLFTNLTDGAGYVGSATSNLTVSVPVQTTGNTDFQVIITNSSGVITSSIATLTVSSAAVALTQDISTTPTAVAGYPFALTVNATGSGPITYQWQYNGNLLSDGGRISGSQSNILTIANVQPGDAGNYQAIVTGHSGTIDSSLGVLAVTNAIGIYDGSTWTLNGGPVLTNGILTMTTATNNEARTAFFNAFPINVDSFQASYVYQDLSAGGADGVSFILQNSERGVSALGGAGGSEGYQLGSAGAQGIAPSVGFEMEVYSNDGMALCTNASNATYGKSTVAGMLATGDPILVNILYSSRVFAVTMTDQTVGSVFKTEYNVDLPSWLGYPGGPRGDTAIIGFGGGTGGANALQQVSALSYGTNSYPGNPLVITNWNDPQWDTTGNSLGHFVISEYYGATGNNFGTLTIGNAQFVQNDGRFTAPTFDIARNQPNFGSATPQVNLAKICSTVTVAPAAFSLATVPGHHYELQLLFHDNYYAARNARQFAVNLGGATTVPFLDLYDLGAGSTLARAVVVTNLFTAASSSTSITFSFFRDNPILNALTLVDMTITPGFITQATNQVVYSGNSTQLVSLAGGEGPITYQWQARAGGTSDPFTNVINGPTVSGSTTNVLGLSNLSVGSVDFQTVAINPYGYATSSIANVTIVTSAPILAVDINPLTLSVPTNYEFSLSATIIGSLPATYQWLHNGSPLSDGGRISGSHSNVLSIASAIDPDAGTYQVLATNAYGNTNSSVATVNIDDAPLGFLDGSAWTLNGGPDLTSGVLVITDGGGNEGRSAFYDFPVDINAFTAAFTYQDVTGGGADGTAFVLQNDPRGRSALGGAGGTLGYGNSPLITNSVAFEMNIYNNSAVNLETNGTTGTYVLTGTNVNIRSGDPINVNIVYQQGLMVVTMTDANTLGSITNTYNINVANVVGGTNAYIGFTGGSGGSTAVQYIQNFAFGPLPASAPTIQQDVPTVVAQPVGLKMNLGVLAIGSSPLYYQWYFNGGSLTNSGQITGVKSNALSLAYTVPGDTGNYQVIVSNFYGTATSSVAAVTITNEITVGDGSDWSFNGATLPAPGTLQLTDGNYSEAQSAFLDDQVDIDAFVASFTYQDLSGTAAADGLAFVLQNSPAGAAALGADAGGLGFSGISPSAALTFNLYSGSGVGMAFETNGLSYIFGGNSSYVSTAPVPFNNGDLINVTMYYANGVVSVTLTDPVTQASYQTNYTANLPGLLGGHLAYVGFTGGTGAIASQQQISNFSFLSLATLGIKSTQTNTTVLTWPVATGAYSVQANSDLTTTNWMPVTNSVSVISNLLNQVIITPSGAQEFYNLINQQP